MRRLPIAAAALLVAALACPAASASASRDELTTRTSIDRSSPSIILTSGSDVGFTFSTGPHTDEAQTYGYRLLRGPGEVRLPLGQRAIIAGHILWQGSGPIETRTWTATDLDAGAVVQQTTDTFVAQDNTRFFAALPHGFVMEDDDVYGGASNPPINASELIVEGSDGSSVKLDFGEVGVPRQAAGDDHGVLATWSTADGSHRTGWFSIPAAGSGATTVKPTMLEPYGTSPSMSPDAPKTLAVAADAVAYVAADGNVVRYSRVDGSLTEHPTTGTVTELAASTAGTAWETAGSPETITSCAEPNGTCSTIREAVAGTDRHDVPYSNSELLADGFIGGVNPDVYVPSQGVVSLGSGFATGTGTNRTDHAVRHLQAGSPSVGTVIDMVGSSAPEAVDLAPGRLVIELGYDLYTQPLTSSGLGAATSVPGTARLCLPSASSGSRTVVAIPVPGTDGCAKSDVVVMDSGQVVATFPDLDADLLSLSGDRLLVDTSSRAKIFDLSHPSQAPIAVRGAASVYADRVAYIASDRSIHLRDLATGLHDTSIHPPPPGDDVGTGDLQLFGDWVLWKVTTYHGSNYDVSHDLDVEHLTADGRVDRQLTLSATLSPDIDNDVILRDGFIAYIASDLTVHVHDLASGGDQTVGRVANPGAGTLAASDDAVAWVSPDNLIHVLTVHPKHQVGPQLLSLTSTVTAGLAARAHIAGTHATKAAAPLAVRADLSRPATTWTLTVRDASGRVVWHKTSKASNGTIRASWDGRVKGAMRPGHYTWTLTGKGRGGAIVGRGGHKATMKGSLTL